MLKFIYKIMLVSLLSGSLMMMDFNFKGQLIQSAQAETLKTDGVKDGNLMATLTMTAVGVLTQRLWKCKLTTDMMVAAAGGAMFVGGEILAFIKLKKVMKDMETEITRDKDGKVNQKQIETLEQLRKSYEEAKKTANTKKMLQQAAAAAFAAAAVIAYTQASSETAAEAACTKALAAAAVECNTICADLAAGTYTAAMAPPYCSGGAQSAAASGTNASADIAEKVPAPSSANAATATAADTTNTATESTASAQCPVVAGAAATCTSKRTIKMMTRGVCMVPPSVASLPIPGFEAYANAYTPAAGTNAIYKIFSTYFLSEARADLFSPMGIASGAAISYLLATSATLGVTIDTYLFSPMNRAIVWGVLGGLTFAASSATDNVIAQIDANIAKIDGILKGMYSLANGTQSTNPTLTKPAITKSTPTSNTIETLDYQNGELGLDGLPSGKLPCYTGDDPKKCTSFEEQIQKDAGFIAMNLPSQNLIKGIMKTADGFNGRTKITKSAMSDAAKLAGNANALNANLKKSKNALKDLLKKSKIDLDKKEKEFSDAIEKSNRAQLKKRNMSASQMLGSMYGGSSFPTGTGVAAVPANPEKTAGASSGGNAPAIVDISSSAPVTPMDLGVTDANSELTPEEIANQEAIAAAANKSGPTIDDYDLKNDITKDKDSSLFELISNRYQKSGFQRLFKRK